MTRLITASNTPHQVGAVATTRLHSTLGRVLKEHAGRTPDSPFLVFEHEPGVIETITWAQQLARARGTAAALQVHGIRHGDRIGVHLTNCPEFYDVWLGASLLGAVIVPTNPLYTSSELAYVINHAECRLVVTQPDLRETVRSSGVGTIIGIDEGMADTDSSSCAFGETKSSDLAAVLYTSGTTSRPKGVLVSHAAYLSVGDAVAGHLRVRSEDRQLIVLPLFHGNAQYYSTMSAFVTGASIALSPRFSASRWSQQARALRATISSLFAAPMRMILAQEPDDADRTHQLRVVIFAQSLSASQSATFEQRFATPILQLYGMTETVLPPLMNPLYERRDPLSMGRPIAGARVRLVAESGGDVRPGEAGEVLVGGEPGATLMSGYLNDPGATAVALRDGWLHTGDVARQDGYGYFHFVDRAKDMLKRSGENISCSEVEAVINGHPGVFESAAVGFPDEIRDEALWAFVVRNEGSTLTTDELLYYCREHMAKFKIPDSVIFVDTLPRTSVGKIQKHRLRDAANTTEH